MSIIFLSIAESILEYGIKRGIKETLFSEEDFTTRLSKIIYSTIDEYEKLYSMKVLDRGIAFYDSEIIVEELLKYRLFSAGGSEFNSSNIKEALNNNPNIVCPSDSELKEFGDIFYRNIKKDEKLKTLEINAFYKQSIFNIEDKVNKIYDSQNQEQTKKAFLLLEKEYQNEINKYKEEINELKFKTALEHLLSLDSRVNENSQYIKKEIQASLTFSKGICFEALSRPDEAYEMFIKAYKIVPSSKSYLEKACISYFYLKDRRYEVLKKEIERYDNYNPYCRAIDTINSEDWSEHIKEHVPKNVLRKHLFRRIIFNKNLSLNKIDALILIELFNISIDRIQLQTSIAYNDFHYFIFILNVYSVSFFRNNNISFFEFIKKDKASIKFIELSKTLSKIIEKGELSNDYNIIVFYYYWLECELLQKDKFLEKLKDSYNLLEKKDLFSTLLLCITLQKHNDSESAFRYVNEFDGELDENLVTFKAFSLIEKGQSLRAVTEFFEFIKHIDTYNIQNVCSYLVVIIRSNVIKQNELEKLLGDVCFSEIKYQKLVYFLVVSLFCSNFELKIDKIDNLKKEISGEHNLYYFISLLFFENKYFSECVQFQETYVSEDEETRDLNLYIRALDRKKQDKLKLLRILKKWRSSFSFHADFLKLEIELQRILKNWKEIEEIARYALGKLPDDEFFYTVYIIALSVNKKQKELSDEITKITHFSFQSTTNALNVVSNLAYWKHFEAAIELLYEKALNNADSLARMHYINFSVNSPTLFKEYDKVCDDCFVKFKISNEIKTIHVNENTKSQTIIQRAINKKVGDRISLEKKYSKKIITVEILRIMNKYLSLLDEIFTEVNSPFSNLPMEVIDFEPSNMKDFEDAIIQNFGAQEDERRKHRQKVFQEYQNYHLPFSLVTFANFNNSFIDAYYYLTSNVGNGFFIKPLKYLNPVALNSKKLVIDFTSGLLFYELSSRFDLRLNEFIVSSSTFELIEELINDMKHQSKSKISLSIYSDKVVPNFYSKDFYNNRHKFLNELKSWFQNNAKPVDVEEKIELLRPLDNNGEVTVGMEYVIENTLLAQRENHMLITDDIIYQNHLGASSCLTSEQYLRHLFPNKINEILEMMLSFRYIGLTVNPELLYSAYINQFKEGSKHIYSYGLQNLFFAYNFNKNNIETTVDLLKKIALNPVIGKEKYRYEATKILNRLVYVLPNNSFSFFIKNLIIQKFQLLGEYLDITLKVLSDINSIHNR